MTGDQANKLQLYSTHSLANHVLALYRKRRPNSLNRHRQPRNHQLRLKPQHAIPKPRKRAVLARVSAAALSMRAAVNFNDKPHGRSEKIYDVLPDGHLAFE